MKRPDWLISRVGAGVIAVLGASYRIERIGAEHIEAARAVFPGVIHTFWHGRLLPLAWAHRHQGAYVLASEHADGELLGTDYPASGIRPSARIQYARRREGTASAGKDAARRQRYRTDGGRAERAHP